MELYELSESIDVAESLDDVKELLKKFVKEFEEVWKRFNDTPNYSSLKEYAYYDHDH